MSERPPIYVCSEPELIVPVLRKEMKLASVTQTELGDHIGVSYVTINRMLTGKTPISIDQLFRILAHLGIGVALAPPKAAAPKDVAALPAKRKPPVGLGVSLHDLFNADKIKAGDILTSIPGAWNTFAEVGLRGDLILEDGSEYTSPSSAAKAVRGTTTNGWDFWGIDGHSLRELRDAILG